MCGVHRDEEHSSIGSNRDNSAIYLGQERAYSADTQSLAYRDNNGSSADRAYIRKRHPYIRGTCVFVADGYISSSLHILHTDYVFFDGRRCSGPHRGRTSSYPFRGDRCPNRHRAHSENDVCRVRRFVSPRIQRTPLVGDCAHTFPYPHIPHNGFVASDVRRCFPLCIPHNDTYVCRAHIDLLHHIRDSTVSYGRECIPHFLYTAYSQYVPYCVRISRPLYSQYRCKDICCVRTSCADTWASLWPLW